MSEQTDRAERALREQFGETDEAVAVVSAPGRVNLIGGHTDYNEGFVLPTAIDRRTVIAGRRRSDDAVNVYSCDLEDRESAALGDLRPSDDVAWADYIIGVINQALERGHDVGGLDLAIASDVPMGAGVSSSAALEVAAAGAVDTLYDLGLSDEEIATIAWEAETEFVGVGCGIMDQFAATFGEADSALFLDCRSREVELVPFGGGDVKILVVDTAVQHDLVESAYNERVRQCREGVEALERALGEPVSSLRDVSAEAFAAHADDLPETVRKRCRHVIDENERVNAAVEALRAGNLETVGSLMERSHESLREDYETSCEELDLVVELAAEQEGVLGSRMTGAGFGGSVVALVRSDAVDEVRETIRTSYREETGIGPEIYACEPADGYREESVGVPAADRGQP